MPKVKLEWALEEQDEDRDIDEEVFYYVDMLFVDDEYARRPASVTPPGPFGALLRKWLNKGATL